MLRRIAQRGAPYNPKHKEDNFAGWDCSGRQFSNDEYPFNYIFFYIDSIYLHFRLRTIS